VISGAQAVEMGLIDAVGTLGDALDELYRMIAEEKK
jgi:ClpP class serine protease